MRSQLSSKEVLKDPFLSAMQARPPISPITCTSELSDQLKRKYQQYYIERYAFYISNDNHTAHISQKMDCYTLDEVVRYLPGRLNLKFKREAYISFLVCYNIQVIQKSIKDSIKKSPGVKQCCIIYLQLNSSVTHTSSIY